MRRHDNWPNIMDEVIASYEDKPFVWGKADCCLFPADVVLAMTGIDFLEKFRGKYKTKIGAFRLLKKRTGFADVPEALDAILTSHGFLAKNPRKAQRGDVTLVVADNGSSLALIGPKGLPVGMAPHGLIRLTPADAERAWGTM